MRPCMYCTVHKGEEETNVCERASEEGLVCHSDPKPDKMQRLLLHNVFHLSYKVIIEAFFKYSLDHFALDFTTGRTFLGKTTLDTRESHLKGIK